MMIIKWIKISSKSDRYHGVCERKSLFLRKGYKTLKRLFSEKMRKVYLRNDKILVVSKFLSKSEGNNGFYNEKPLFYNKGV